MARNARALTPICVRQEFEPKSQPQKADSRGHRWASVQSVAVTLTRCDEQTTLKSSALSIKTDIQDGVRRSAVLIAAP